MAVMPLTQYVNQFPKLGKLLMGPFLVGGHCFLHWNNWYVLMLRFIDTVLRHFKACITVVSVVVAL